MGKVSGPPCKSGSTDPSFVKKLSQHAPLKEKQDLKIVRVISNDRDAAFNFIELHKIFSCIGVYTEAQHEKFVGFEEH